MLKKIVLGLLGLIAVALGRTDRADDAGDVHPNGRASIGSMMAFDNLAEEDLLTESPTMGNIVRTIAVTFQPRFEDMTPHPDSTFSRR